jgi:hypothetical protein
VLSARTTNSGARVHAFGSAAITVLRSICPPSINGASAATYATAKLLAQEGAKVVVTARRQAELDALVVEIGKAGGGGRGEDRRGSEWLRNSGSLRA